VFTLNSEMSMDLFPPKFSLPNQSFTVYWYHQQVVKYIFVP
jgi:hypothetical protein